MAEYCTELVIIGGASWMSEHRVTHRANCPGRAGYSSNVPCHFRRFVSSLQRGFHGRVQMHPKGPDVWHLHKSKTDLLIVWFCRLVAEFAISFLNLICKLTIFQKVGPTGRNVHGLFCECFANVSANENGMRTLCPILAPNHMTIPVEGLERLMCL